MASMYALRQQKVRVPDDIAIIGFNDEPVSALMTPSLSSVAQPTVQMGRMTVDLLMQQIAATDQEFIPVTKVFEMELKIRESSNRLRQ
jgi:DNA-binding LacI/PurR family transcriptional regulator